MVAILTGSSAMEVVPYGILTRSRRIPHTKREQMQHPLYPSFSPGRVSGVVSASHPSSSSFSVGSSYRVAALHGHNIGPSQDTQYAASSVIPNGLYSVVQAPQGYQPYSSFYPSQQASESSPAASYSPNPSGQSAVGSLNQDPYEVFVRMNPHIRTYTGI